MRQLQVFVPPESADRVVGVADRHGAVSTSVAIVRTRGTARALVLVDVPNDALGPLVDDVADAAPGARFNVVPQGTIPIEPPLSRVQESVRDVERRSTLELIMGSLQSLGSWKGMLLYAAFSGLVAAYGVISNTSYLLTAAMLIAPMGAPATVCIVAAATGDGRMFGRGTVRFFSALLVLTTAGAAFGLAYGLRAPSAMMEQIASISAWAVLLGIVGGAAGAQAQVLSERNSLVTGTATGFLVAVSLSPPSAALGLALTLRRWDDVSVTAFQLLLTFVAIVAGGVFLLASYGVRSGETAIDRGTRPVRPLLSGAAVLATAGLVLWQSGRGTLFRKVDASAAAIEAVHAATNRLRGVRLLDAGATFTRTSPLVEPAEGILIRMTVQNDTRVPDDSLIRMLRRDVVHRVRSRITDVEPFIDVTVLRGAAGP